MSNYPDKVKCGCCDMMVYTTATSARGWCTKCEMEFFRVLHYLRALVEIAKHVIARGK